MDDDAFDALFPEPLRAGSEHFYTRVATARRAAELFAGRDAVRVLDVGSGAGKLCLVAACARPELELTGIEHRPHLVEAAIRAAGLLGVTNVRFVAGDAAAASWSGFDGVYLFNPFAENLYNPDEQLDDTVALSYERFRRDVRRVLRSLAAAPAGTCVVTHHGYGGPIPASYQLVHAERADSDWLRLWVKGGPGADPGAFYVEERDGVSLVASRRAREAGAPGGAEPPSHYLEFEDELGGGAT